MQLIIKKRKSGLKHKIMSIKRKKSHTKSSMKKVKRTSHKSKPNNMKRKNKSRKSKSGFSSKLKIPGLSKLTDNPTVSKVAKSAGTVAIVGAIVSAVNQPAINSIWQNQIVRSAVAYSSGDIVGAVGTYALENNLLQGLRGGNGSVTNSQVGFA